MNKRIGILTLILFGILVLTAALILFRNDWLHPGQKAEPTPSPTTTPEAEVTPTPEPTMDPEKDPRFFDTNSVLICVNKKHRLPEGYEPADLRVPHVEMRYNTWSLRDEAAAKLEEMFQAAVNENIHLVMGSGYRSEAFQKTLYDSYVQRDGVEKADTYCARPGYSDNQTGLATDICGQDPNYDLTSKFDETPEGKWLALHAHEYGFIMVYPKDKEEITGYRYEPWHYRYIGADNAKELHSELPNMTFEEFYHLSGGDYAG